MRLLLLIAIFSGATFAAEVLKVASNNRLVAVSHDLTRRWQVNDKLCVVREGKEIACGVIIKVKEKFGILRLKEENNSIGRGDKVVANVPNKAPSILVGSDTSSTPVDLDHSPFYLISLGGTVGPNIAYPSLHLQRIVDPLFSIGLLPSYLSIEASNKAFSSVSLLASFNFYPKEFFREFWIMGALGVAFMSTSLSNVEQQATVLQFLLTGGYRIQLGGGVLIGVGGGLQYLKDPNFSGISIKGTGFKPIFTADIGVNF